MANFTQDDKFPFILFVLSFTRSNICKLKFYINFMK